MGAKVNGKIVPLDFGLKNGDIVEVLDQQVERTPVTGLALDRQDRRAQKHKIKQWFRKERRKEENAVLGQEMLESELVRIGLRTDAARGEVIEKIAGKLNYSTVNDLYAAIGFGDANAASVAKRLREELKTDNVVDIQTLPRPTSTRRVARKRITAHPDRRRR